MSADVRIAEHARCVAVLRAEAARLRAVADGSRAGRQVAMRERADMFEAAARLLAASGPGGTS